MAAAALSHFDRLFQADADPWNYLRSPYERRKRDLTLAILPRRPVRRAFEPGCANGVLSESLAARCARLVCMDGSAAAVELARQRLAPQAHVEVAIGRVPASWPEGRFDLIVVSELGYYLHDADLREFTRKVRGSLADDGAVVACHWRHAEPDFACDAATVHAALDAALAGAARVDHVDPDFLLQAWTFAGDAP
jgi:2-polyprenyl-3-methyl-5-hydroxy-6-metoxy-1,4-benzoquinol methylase